MSRNDYLPKRPGAIDRWRLVTDNNEHVGRESIISTSKFQMSLKSLICMESYYFQVYVVSCDVHCRSSDDAFMWTA